MNEGSKSNHQFEEEDEKNEIINLENDNPENSTEHLNRPLINIEKNVIKINESQEENLKLIQDRINQEINLGELEEIKLKKNSKENSSLKCIKKYQNLSISNNNFHISKTDQKLKNSKNIKINYNFKNSNNKNNLENKYIKYNDELKRYYFNKEFSNLHISTEENFLERMKFDIYKRQIKEKKIDDFVQNNKVKIKEEKKIKTFNHLIEDANRRLKAQINSEILNTQLSQDLLKNDEPKKYNDDEWETIYNKRFKNFLDKVNRKKKENIKFFEEEKKKKEEEILNSLPNKKASKKHIQEIVDKMYEEAMKRNIKKKEIMEQFYNIKINNLPINKNIKIKNEEKQVNQNDKDNNLLSNYLITKTNNSKSFNNKLKINKSAPKIVKKKKGNDPFKNMNNSNSQQKNQNKDNIYDYNLEKERQLLIKMATSKKLPGEINNNKLLNNFENIQFRENDMYFEDNYTKKESDKIIDEFFMRQII